MEERILQSPEMLRFGGTTCARWSRASPGHHADIETTRITEADLPTLRRIVVSIDPAVTSGEDSDETGIIVCALGADGRGYVLEDRSGNYSPDGWAR